MEDQSLSLELKISPTAATSDHDLDEMTRNLLIEIQDDMRVRADLKPSEAPTDARTHEAVILGGIWLTILPILINRLFDLLVSWLKRNQPSTITIILVKNHTAINIRSDSQPEELEEIKRTLLNAPRK